MILVTTFFALCFVVMLSASLFDIWASVASYHRAKRMVGFLPKEVRRSRHDIVISVLHFIFLTFLAVTGAWLWIAIFLT